MQAHAYPAYPEHEGNQWRAPNADGDIDDGTGDAEVFEQFSLSYSRPKKVVK